MIDLDTIKAGNEQRRAVIFRTHDVFYLADYFVNDDAPEVIDALMAEIKRLQSFFAWTERAIAECACGHPDERHTPLRARGS